MKLRKWQTKAFKVWWELKRGIVKVVTGGGKTYFAIYIINKYIEMFPNHKVLIVVPTIQLLDQWSFEIKKMLNLNQDLNGGGFKSKKINQITISTLGSLKNIYSDFDDKKTFLIVDECHKLGTNKKGEMLEQKWPATLGLSATPEREFDENFEKIIEPILGNIIFNYDYIEAYKDGVISNFKLVNAYAPLMENEDVEYEKVTKKINKRIAILGEFDKNDAGLKLLLFKRARIVNNALNRIPLGIKLIKKYKAYKKWIVFCESKKQASIFNEFLNKNNFRSAIYNTDLSKNFRFKNLIEFKEDMLDAIVTCKALDEGFDYPNIDAALIVSSSSSNRQRIQRIGRALRISENKINSLIITIYSSDSEFKKLKDESLEFTGEGIEVSWTKLKS